MGVVTCPATTSISLRMLPSRRSRRGSSSRIAYNIFSNTFNRSLLAEIAIEPTPEQREWIRNHVIQHIKDTRLSPTLEQREALMLEIYDMLDEPRQTKLFLYMTRAAMSRN